MNTVYIAIISSVLLIGIALWMKHNDEICDKCGKNKKAFEPCECEEKYTNN
jgi:hypothetical protein